MGIHSENKMVLGELREGDLVEFECQPLASHWAVYVGNGVVVHLTGDPADEVKGPDTGDVLFTSGSQRFRKASIRKTDFFEAACGRKAVCNNIRDNDDDIQIYPSAVIVSRAETKISENIRHAEWTNTCKCFALWCRYGEAVAEPSGSPPRSPPTDVSVSRTSLCIGRSSNLPAEVSTVVFSFDFTSCRRMSGNPEPLIQSEEDERYYSFTFLDLGLCILSIVLYVADVGTDVHLAVTYFLDGHWKWGGLTAAVIVVNYVIVSVTAFLIYWHNVLPKRWRVLRTVFLILPLAPVMMMVEYIHEGLKMRRERQERNPPAENGESQCCLGKNLSCSGNSTCCSETPTVCSDDLEEPYRKAALYKAFLSLLESFFEAAPQLCLQLYIVFRTKPTDDIVGVTLRAFVITTSLASRALSAASYYKSDRIKRTKGKSSKLPMYGLVLYCTWRLFETGARVLCISLFASTFRGWVFCVLGVHFAACVLWNGCLTYNRETNENPETSTCMKSFYGVLIGFVVGLATIFCFFDPFHTPDSRYRYAVWYAVFYAENLLMFCLWLWKTPDTEAWFFLPAIVTVLACSLLHVLLLLLFYTRLCHPSTEVRSPDIITQRAESWIMYTMPYHKRTTSCQRFAEWCRYHDTEADEDAISTADGRMVAVPVVPESPPTSSAAFWQRAKDVCWSGTGFIQMKVQIGPAIGDSILGIIKDPKPPNQ
ncbi:hypothetical protein BaRGS_00011724 [Batillaria attramentaria]|uniref:XK-related protein n=1 Tax=Batillaria attramentaria TaxID=370345 RepID=A0ABD0LC36_9CAEN